MLKAISSFLNIPIISIYNSKKVGEVFDFIVEPSSGRIVGLIGERYGFLKRKNKVIADIDVREISPRALIVDSEDALVAEKDIVKLAEIIKSGKKVLKNKVYSQSGKYIGKVYDYLIDDFFYIQKLYIYPPFFNIFENQLIVSRKNVIAIEKKGIIINDIKREKIKEPKTVKIPS